MKGAFAFLLALALPYAAAAAEGDAAVAPEAPPPNMPDEEAIRRALEADQAAASPKEPPPTAAPVPAAAPPGTTRLNLLNPAISVIVDGAFGYYGVHGSNFPSIGIPPSGDDPGGDGFTLQEIELGFQAPVDPYLEGSVFLTIPNLEGLEVEEAYLLTTDLPWNLQIKAGTFRSHVGRNNAQHLHVQNFTRRPLMTPLLFGADGFRGPGAEVSWLIPRLPWFATFYAEAFSIPAAGEPEPGATVLNTFGGGTRGNLAYAAVLDQFWPISDAVSLLLGLNFATARASECAPQGCSRGPRDYLYGADLYFKWRPPTSFGEHHALAWTTEYFARTVSEGGPTEGALYSEPVIRLAQRWYLGGRFETTGLPAGPSLPRRYAAAGSFTFTPSEFSRIRAYGQELWGPGAQTTLVGFLQFEYALGAHGAHAF